MLAAPGTLTLDTYIWCRFGWILQEGLDRMAVLSFGSSMSKNVEGSI